LAQRAGVYYGLDIAAGPVEVVNLRLDQLGKPQNAKQGSAHALPFENESLDAVVSIGCFHHTGSIEKCINEAYRVLKPGGKLGLIWNVRDESVDWVLAITKIITPYEGDAPRFYKGDWRKPLDGRYFTAPEKTSFEYRHVGLAQQVILDRFLSVSFIAALPDGEKLKVAEQLHGLIASHPALYQKGEIVFPYRTEAYLCIRLEEITDVSGD